MMYIFLFLDKTLFLFIILISNIKNFYFNAKTDDEGNPLSLFSNPRGEQDYNDLIQKEDYDNLLKEFPQIPLVCEEGNLRVIDKETFWLIDPIDGTSSFIEGNDQFAICIALIQNKKAVFGLIYAPVFEGGKMAVTNDKNQVILIDRGGNKTIPRGKRNEDSDFRIIASVRAKQSDIDLFMPHFIHRNTSYKNIFAL